MKIERENQTLATITFQNYFRMYKKLSGMTGTAETEAEEFGKIYNLDVVVIPTNRPMSRIEEPDLVYRTEREKYDAIVDDIIEQAGRRAARCWSARSRSRSPSGSRRCCKRRGIQHVVLNAKYHAQEAEIVAQAGRKGAVTIATNMAGRGTDILLGGNAEFMARQQCLAEEVAETAAEGRGAVRRRRGVRLLLPPRRVLPRAARRTGSASSSTSRRRPTPSTTRSSALGGLHILGTERHEARRIDNQLRGRAGRQGDPGSSRFYLSLEDDLMRIFGSDRISGLMQRLGMEEGVPIEHGMVTRAIERAQKQVEAQNFAVRKHLLEYDDVMNKQRESIYALRREILEGKIRIDEDEVVDTREYLMTLAEDLLDDTVETLLPASRSIPSEWDLEALQRELTRLFGLDGGDFADVELRRRPHDRRDPRRALGAASRSATRRRSSSSARELLRRVERDIMLQIVDAQWKDHLYASTT